MRYQDPYLYNDPYQFQPYQYTGYQAYGQPAPLSYEQQQQQQGGGFDGMQGLQMAKQMGLFDKAAPVANQAGGNSLIGGMEGSAPWQNIFGGGGQTAGSLQGGGAMGGQGGGAMVGNAGAGGAGGAAAGGAGGGGFGGAMAAAGPWAALAAAVLAYEGSAYDQGRRGDDTNDYLKSRATGKWLEQDAEYYADKLFGDEDKYGMGATMTMVPNLLTGDFSNAFSDFDDSTIMKPIHLIGDLF